MDHRVYDTLLWRLVAARARKRDGNRCTVARLLGGDCTRGTLHVHHIRPVSEGGDQYDLDNLATVCAAHHPVWEALRRRILGGLNTDRAGPPRCRHVHRTAAARAECEARLAREDEAQQTLIAV